MISKSELVIVVMNDLHHRSLELRDHLMKGETLLLTRRGKPLAVIKPLAERARIPGGAVVRSISYIRRHKREFTFKLMDGEKVVLTYRGKKIGFVDPGLLSSISGE